jgi:hypothetical protein
MLVPPGLALALSSLASSKFAFGRGRRTLVRGGTLAGI